MDSLKSWGISGLAGVGTPTLAELMIDPQLIANPRHHKINQVRNGDRVIVETGHGREDDRSRFRQPLHVFQRDQTERCFAWHND